MLPVQLSKQQLNAAAADFSGVNRYATLAGNSAVVGEMVGQFQSLGQNQSNAPARAPAASPEIG